VPIVGDDGRQLGVVEVGSFIDAEFLEAFEEDGTAYTVFFVKDGGFAVFAASPAARAPRLSPSLLQQALAGGSTVAVRSGDHPIYLSTAAQLRGITEEAIGVVQIDIDTTSLESSYALALKLLFGGLLVIGTLAALAMFATIAGILRPLERLLRAVKDIAADHTTAAVPLLKRGDELGDLARAIESFRAGREELRSARDQAQTVSRVLQDVIDNVPAVINFKDTTLRYVMVNRACAEFYGVSKEEMIGRRISDMASGLDMSALERSEREVMDSGQASLPREFTGVNRAGHFETWWTVKAPVWNDAGKLVGLVTVALNFTDLKDAQRTSERTMAELVAANRLLEQQAIRLERLNREYFAEREAAVEASRAKTQFLANMSHELRTPLNAVIGYSEVLSGEMFGPIPQRYLEYSKSILVSGQHLLEIINDILDMSRIEAGSYLLTLESTALSEPIGAALRLLRPRAEEKQQKPRLHIDDALPKVLIDRRAIRQVVLNLVGNAIKFTLPGGRIEISATRRPDRSVTIVVRDNGPGIAADHLSRVFQPFWQGEEARTRKHEGTGLGLSISKRLVELHNGTIEIDSTVGVGTVVTVVLPPDCVDEARA
jgi:PAS domain S-box-containing protein